MDISYASNPMPNFSSETSVHFMNDLRLVPQEVCRGTEILTYKFRLYPTTTQARIMEGTLETCRLLYNAMLADRIENGTGFYEQKRRLVELKRSDKHLRSIHSQVLQDVVLRLDKAYGASFTGLGRYPRFKRNGHYNSFTYPQSGFRLEGNRIRLSTIGKIKVRLHRQVAGVIKRATVIRDIDQWFVALLVEGPSVVKRAGNGKVGVDVGVSNLAVLSDGTQIDNPRFLNHSAGRIKSLQKQLSHKKRGSHNREKAKLSLAKAWRKVRRQRDDFAHKISDKITRENRFIVFEDLAIRNMVRNHSLASAIMDSAWGRLRQFTAYKAERRGGRVILVNPSGTSQKCSRCGETVPKDLSARSHRCPRCGLVIDRDVNAARNILKAGLERARVEAEPLLVRRRRISKFGR
jgi:putative transposase